MSEATTTVSVAALAPFSKAFQGEIVLPGSAGYDAARIVWNGMIDRRPAIVARCDGADNVVRAIRFGREQHLPIAVRSGGHSIGGFSTCDDGIVIDLSLMRGVRVDPEQRTAQVNGGALLGELDREAQALNSGDWSRRVSFGPRQAPMIVSSGVVASVSARSWAAQRFISWAVRLPGPPGRPDGDDPCSGADAGFHPGERRYHRHHLRRRGRHLYPYRGGPR